MAKIEVSADDIKQAIPLITGSQPDPNQVPFSSLAPGGPPPATPAVAGWGAWAADPQNQQKVTSSMTPPNQPLTPPPPAPPPSYAPPAPPTTPMASANPPQMAPSPMTPPTQADWATAHPELQAHPVIGKGAGKAGNILQFLTAGLAGASGGLKGDPMAGLEYAQGLGQYNRSIPDINQSRYRAAIVQPQIDQLAMQKTRAQTAQATAAAGKSDAQADALPEQLKQKQVASAARNGQKPVYDDKGNLAGYEDDPNSGVFQRRQAATDLADAQVGSTKAQQELRDAQAALARAKNDPNSPAYRQAQQRINVASQNASTAAGRLQLAGKTYEMRAHGTENGVALPGSMQDDNGNTIGSMFQANVRPTNTERNKGDMAASAAEQLAMLKEIATRRKDMFGPGSGRGTEFTRWLGSQDPDAQRFVAARTIAGDHLAGTFGGRSEAALTAIDNAIGQFKDNPEAALAGIDQLTKANTRFQKAGTPRTTGSKAANPMQPPTSPSITVGQKVKLKSGQTITVKAVHPDGSFE